MMDFLNFMFDSFPKFFGCMALIYLCLYFPCNLILQIVHKSIRSGTIRLKGYPPPHCDGDGDFLCEYEEESEPTLN